MSGQPKTAIDPTRRFTFLEAMNFIDREQAREFWFGQGAAIFAAAAIGFACGAWCMLVAMTWWTL